MTVRGTCHYLDTCIWETSAWALTHLHGNTQCLGSFVASPFCFSLCLTSRMFCLFWSARLEVSGILNQFFFLHCFSVLFKKYLLKLWTHKNEVDFELLLMYWKRKYCPLLLYPKHFRSTSREICLYHQNLIWNHVLLLSYRKFVIDFICNKSYVNGAT